MPKRLKSNPDNSQKTEFYDELKSITDPSRRTFTDFARSYMEQYNKQLNNDQQKLTWQSVANRIDMPYDNLHRYISGTRKPSSREIVIQIAMGLMMDLKDCDRLLESYPILYVKLKAANGPFDRLVMEYYEPIVEEFKNSDNDTAENSKIKELNQRLSDAKELKLFGGKYV